MRTRRLIPVGIGLIISLLLSCEKENELTYNFTNITKTSEFGAVIEEQIDLDDWNFNDTWQVEVETLFEGEFKSGSGITSLDKNISIQLKSIPKPKQDSVFVYPGYGNPCKEAFNIQFDFHINGNLKLIVVDKNLSVIHRVIVRPGEFKSNNILITISLNDEFQKEAYYRIYYLHEGGFGIRRGHGDFLVEETIKSE